VGGSSYFAERVGGTLILTDNPQWLRSRYHSCFTFGWGRIHQPLQRVVEILTVWVVYVCMIETVTGGTIETVAVETPCT
jgi:hypothetical protein